MKTKVLLHTENTFIWKGKLKSEKRVYNAEIGDYAVRIGSVVYEPRSGKCWKTQTKWKGYETIKVSSNDMKGAIEGQRKASQY